MYLEIAVTDTGRGIPESVQATIFKRFYREEAVHDVDGIGIGLYLAREIITMQGGYITVESEVGKGSTFSIFPVSYTHLETLKLLINEIAEQSGVPEQYVMYSSTYFGLAEEKSTQELLVIIGASSLIVLACSLVIYSLFYISVIGKTHEYGRLRVLGATSVQIKRIVRKENFLLRCV